MIDGKYVMGAGGVILFPDTIDHATFRFTNPVSAGRFTILADGGDGISVIVYGDSATLELGPGRDDAERIRQQFGLACEAESEGAAPSGSRK